MQSQIVIDARWLVGGIGTYTRHILEGLSKDGQGIELHAITREQHTAEVRQWCSRVTVVNAPIYSLREQWAVPGALNGCDLLHVPHYNAPLLERRRLVITIHDLIHITDPDYRRSWKAWAYARPALNLAARKADHIITVSEYSKAQIVQRLGVPPSKVTAIYHGVDAEFSPIDRVVAGQAVSAALGVREPYILYVGGLRRYKNVSTLLKAFAIFCRRNITCHRLLIVGAPPPRDLEGECAQLGIRPRTDFVPYVGQAMLPELYAAADLLVMPSTIEGFGLPVLEAMACGAPVVCSRAASLPEVGGDAVMYFDPKSAEELAETIERVLSSRELHESLRQKGLKRATHFTWANCVARHVEVYRSVLG